MFTNGISDEDHLRLRWAVEMKKVKQTPRWKMFFVKLFGRHDYAVDGDYILHTIQYRGELYVISFERGLFI